jgi:hypothetical protein
MKTETAARLTALALRVTGDLNDIAAEIQANESEEDFQRLRTRVGRVMGAVYFEILYPTFQEHPDLIPSDFRNLNTQWFCSPSPNI